jgi:hypothetical protein
MVEVPQKILGVARVWVARTHEITSLSARVGYPWRAGDVWCGDAAGLGVRQHLVVGHPQGPVQVAPGLPVSGLLQMLHSAPPPSRRPWVEVPRCRAAEVRPSLCVRTSAPAASCMASPFVCVISRHTCHLSCPFPCQASPAVGEANRGRSRYARNLHGSTYRCIHGGSALCVQNPCIAFEPGKVLARVFRQHRHFVRLWIPTPASTPSAGWR